MSSVTCTGCSGVPIEKLIRYSVPSGWPLPGIAEALGDDDEPERESNCAARALLRSAMRGSCWRRVRLRPASARVSCVRMIAPPPPPEAASLHETASAAASSASRRFSLCIFIDRVLGAS